VKCKKDRPDLGAIGRGLFLREQRSGLKVTSSWPVIRSKIAGRLHD
jgi:hypothetical protein